MLSTGLFFVAGIILLLGGAHLLVSSSSTLAVRFGIPTIFIGVTIVAFATSAPEIAVSLDAVLEDRAGLALGNVLGSNIANILLILGLSAVIAPIKVTKRVVWLDIPIMILASVALYVLALDQKLQPMDGVIMLVLFAGFMVFQIQQARKDKNNNVKARDENQEAEGEANPYLQGVLLLLGLALLALGAHWLVESAITIARIWGLSELIIGLTIVAIGTSLPELATSVLAAGQNESDLSVGNVIGSNIFNILLVLGISAFFSSDGLPISSAALSLDLPFMVAVSIACLPIFFTGHIIARWEGFVFLGYYAAYLLYLFLDATQHQYLELFNEVMMIFVAPITVLTLVIFAVRSWQKEK
ncbi:calcium/sodium antiporter [Balneolaceae bacterium YR4-1]|uniref:Calcium/sodium antiporter n=1 Tax=Halalkalibaculum roseum TaxID=2709311 RepID=A0A6M1SVG1_9BACT|nr:calcium/sodium antiporter [Halalkalibaculum roseum]NGP76832.1 calcium/sodium antiporter [Halalkalibaculum roseum]